MKPKGFSEYRLKSFCLQERFTRMGVVISKDSDGKCLRLRDAQGTVSSPE